MRNLIFLTTCIVWLVLMFSCQNGTNSEIPETVVIENRHLEKKEGTDCDKPDTLRTNCLQINLHWPIVSVGSEVLKKNSSTWTNTYLIGILAPDTSIDSADSTNVETAVQSFIDSHNEFIKEAPDSPMGQWTAETKNTVLLNNGKHLTVKIEGYVYAGGAHGSPTAAVATFEAQTGKQLAWEDLITDQVALKTLAEKKFRTERADAFKEGFEFDETFPFALPANYGLVENGIYFFYQPYEVGPYALGITELVLSFQELGALSKIQ